MYLGYQHDGVLLEVLPVHPSWVVLAVTDGDAVEIAAAEDELAPPVGLHRLVAVGVDVHVAQGSVGDGVGNDERMFAALGRRLLSLCRRGEDRKSGCQQCLGISPHGCDGLKMDSADKDRGKTGKRHVNDNQIDIMSFNVRSMSNHVLLQVGQDHTGQYHARTDVGDGRHGLVEEDGAGHDGGQRIKVGVVRCLECAELVDDPTPQRKAQEGGHNAQEQSVDIDLRFQEIAQGELPWVDGEHRQHGDQTVEEHLAGEEGGIVVLADLSDEQAVDGPADRRSQGQQVAHGVQAQHNLAVEDDEAHARQRQDGARDELPARLELPVDGQGEERRDEGSRRNDERDVVDIGQSHGHVLTDEVERATRYAEPHHPEFVFPVVTEQPFG